MIETKTTETPTYCANHPGVETTLRCSRCEKPICPRCAVLTPTGYRCKECVRGQQKTFDTSRWYDYPLVFVTIAVLSYIGSLFIGQIGFFAIFLAPIAGVIIAEAGRFVIQRRRSKALLYTATAAAIIGSLPIFLMSLLAMFSSGSFRFIWSLLWQGFYIFSVASTVLYRMGGIKIR